MLQLCIHSGCSWGLTDKVEETRHMPGCIVANLYKVCRGLHSQPAANQGTAASTAGSKVFADCINWIAQLPYPGLENHKACQATTVGFGDKQLSSQTNNAATLCATNADTAVPGSLPLDQTGTRHCTELA